MKTFWMSLALLSLVGTACDVSQPPRKQSQTPPAATPQEVAAQPAGPGEIRAIEKAPPKLPLQAIGTPEPEAGAAPAPSAAQARPVMPARIQVPSARLKPARLKAVIRDQPQLKRIQRDDLKEKDESGGSTAP